MPEKINLGRIMPIHRGDYSSNTTYEKMDVVKSGGATYWCKQQCTGVTPPNDTYWVKLADKGEDGTNGQDGADGLDAYQPFKGWYDTSSSLNTAFPTPQVGDYAFVVGASVSDPVTIYKCATAGTWAASSSTFNPANNQEFASGQSLNTVNIVDNLNSSSATDVLSAKQGKALDQKVAALGPKIDQVEDKVGGMDNSLVFPDKEYVYAILDQNKRFLAGIRKDGSVEWAKGIPTPVKEALDGKAAGAEGKSVIDEIYASCKSSQNCPEYLEVTLDAEGKILYGTDNEGRIVVKTGIKTSSLEFDGNGMSDFAKLLRSGAVISNDWSDASELHLPIPKCAVVNFVGIKSMPQTKTTDAQAKIQFWDMAGNYFCKEVIANAQGNSTMAHPKKNIAIDICNNNGWDDDDTFSLRFGDWVAQDSFHLKAYYNDPFRCLCAIGYMVYEEMSKSRGPLTDYVWKRALLDVDSITSTSTGEELAEDAADQFTTGAKCFPMGFPVIVYLNGDFYGIFAWQLKKHRDNYHMKKSKAKHIHLDGIIEGATLLNANGDSSKIVWTTNNPEGVEVRNPKTLYLMDGTKYDADANGGELIDETSPNYDSTKSDHVVTAEVKRHILDLSRVMTTITAAEADYNSSQKTAADLAAFKAVFETYFDPDNLIDYLILSDVLNNFDGWRKNWQWITYNGTKWYVMPYDLDCILGNWWQLNQTITPPATEHTGGTWRRFIVSYYNEILETRYAELRNAGIIDARHIESFVFGWIDAVGNKDMFEKEWEKWPSYIKNDSPMRLARWIEESVHNCDIIYSYNN